MSDILVIDRAEQENFWTDLKGEWKILFVSAADKGLNMLSVNVGLVFLSTGQPGMNSMEALSIIKKDWPSTAVIMISSGGTEETCMEAFRRGVRDYMKTPLNAEEVLQKIKLLLNARDTSQRRRHISLSVETVPEAHYPDVPSHILNGVLKVRDFIAQNYSESLTLAGACKMASMSKTYFCRFFKDITGHSLRGYHHAVKVQKAEALLRDKDLSVMDVALKLGYSDSNYFSTVYKKTTGISPKYRKRRDISPQPFTHP
ncbi:MAG: DNA-binding response regulator [Nitrospirae bacterium]|nr:DNA-binding response regulator [Nitrospirota bacterium]